MKKTLLIALAGLMLFAFTQCGNGNDKTKENGLTETPAFDKINPQSNR